MLLGLCLVAGSVGETGKPEVAVGDEGTHLERLGERERVTVVVVGGLRETAAGGDLAEEPEGPRFVPR